MLPTKKRIYDENRALNEIWESDYILPAATITKLDINLYGNIAGVSKWET